MVITSIPPSNFNAIKGAYRIIISNFKFGLIPYRVILCCKIVVYKTKVYDFRQKEQWFMSTGKKCDYCASRALAGARAAKNDVMVPSFTCWVNYLCRKDPDSGFWASLRSNASFNSSSNHCVYCAFRRCCKYPFIILADSFSTSSNRFKPVAVASAEQANTDVCQPDSFSWNKCKARWNSAQRAAWARTILSPSHLLMAKIGHFHNASL